MTLNSIIFALIAGAATLAGISLVLWKRNLAIKYSHFINSFAAGALITIALAHLIPDSIELFDNSLLFVLAAFSGFYLLETFMVYHSGSEIHYDAVERKVHRKGIMVFIGLFIHSLVDGIIIAIGFEVSFSLGLFAAAGVILHELPEGITSFAILSHGMKTRTAFHLSLAVALATPIGAAVAIGLLSSLSPAGLGIMIAVAAGSFIYVSASDLIPETHEKSALSNAVFFLAGAGMLYLLGVFFE